MSVKSTPQKYPMSNTFSDGLNVTSGNVGIGTSSPTSALEIDGDIQFSPTIISTAHIDSSGSLKIDADANMEIGHTLVDSVRIGRSNTSLAKIHIRSGSDSDLVVSDGKVGIGMDDPSHSLEIDGDIQLTPTAISTAHIASAGSLKIDADANMEIGHTLVDSVGIGRSTTGAVKVAVRSGSDSDLVVSDGKVGAGTDSPNTQLTVEGAVTLKEQAAADSDTAAYGQLWVKTATPNELYFTDDAGNDVQLVTGGAAAGGGGGISSIVTKTAGYTAVAGTDDVILCNAATLTITLPASSGNTGQTFYIKNIHATGVATIDANGSETIDGALAKYITTQYESLTIVCDGSNWHII